MSVLNLKSWAKIFEQKSLSNTLKRNITRSTINPSSENHFQKHFRHCSTTSTRTFTCDSKRFAYSGKCSHPSRNGYSASFSLAITGLFTQKTLRLPFCCWIDSPPSNFLLSTKGHASLWLLNPRPMKCAA